MIAIDARIGETNAELGRHDRFGPAGIGGPVLLRIAQHHPDSQICRRKTPTKTRPVSQAGGQFTKSSSRTAALPKASN